MVETKDSAWRGHFKRAHHRDLCGARGSARGGEASRVRCLDPACNAAPMALESLGRHWLNLHIGLTFRCPVCGREGQWRESACARHIKRCAENARGL